MQKTTDADKTNNTRKSYLLPKKMQVPYFYIGALLALFVAFIIILTFLFSLDSYDEKPIRPTELNFVYPSEITQTPDDLASLTIGRTQISELVSVFVRKSEPCSIHALICSTLITKTPSETLMKIKSTIPKIKTGNYKIYVRLEKYN